MGPLLQALHEAHEQFKQPQNKLATGLLQLVLLLLLPLPVTVVMGPMGPAPSASLALCGTLLFLICCIWF